MTSPWAPPARPLSAQASDDPPPDEIRRTVEDILERGEFQPPERSPLERAAGWLRDRLEDLLNRIFGDVGEISLPGLGAVDLAGTVLLVVLVGAVVVGLVWALRRLGPLGRRSSTHEPDEFEVSSRRDGRLAEADEWRRRAAEAEAAGDRELAARCWWRAMVAALDDEGALVETPASTAGEYLAQLPEPRAERPPATAATTTFEAAWFGDADVSEPELAELRAATDRAVAVARRRSVGEDAP